MRTSIPNKFLLVSSLMFKTGAGWATMATASSLPLNRRVLITGASGSLGRKVVDKFLKEGFEVIGTRSPFPKASDTSAQSVQTQDADKIEWHQVDLTCSASVGALARQLGRIDALVHCAGGFRFAKIEDLNDVDLEYLMNTNLKSAFYLTREFVPIMKQNNFGRIVFISSKSTLQPGAGVGAYAASKAGLNALASSLAAELVDYDITVNALLPTIIDSQANRNDMPESNVSKWIRPEQLADIVFSLVSPWGAPINGALIPVVGRL